MDSEIVLLYPQFDSLARELCHSRINKEQCDSMKLAVCKLAERLEKGKKEIWKTLIEMRERFTGKAIQSPENQHVRVSELTEFFVNEFEKEDLKSSDMKESYTKPIQQYLM